MGQLERELDARGPKQIFLYLYKCCKWTLYACLGGLLAFSVKKRCVVKPNTFIHGISSVLAVSSLLGSWPWLTHIP